MLLTSPVTRAVRSNEMVERSSRPMIFIFSRLQTAETSSGTFFHGPVYPTIRNDTSERISLCLFPLPRRGRYSSVRSNIRSDRIRAARRAPHPLVIHRSYALSTGSISADAERRRIPGTITRFRVDRFQRPPPIINADSVSRPVLLASRLYLHNYSGRWN